MSFPRCAWGGSVLFVTNGSSSEAPVSARVPGGPGIRNVSCACIRQEDKKKLFPLAHAQTLGEQPDTSTTLSLKIGPYSVRPLHHSSKARNAEELSTHGLPEGQMQRGDIC